MCVCVCVCIYICMYIVQGMQQCEAMFQNISLMLTTFPVLNKVMLIPLAKKCAVGRCLHNISTPRLQQLHIKNNMNIYIKICVEITAVFSISVSYSVGAE